MMPSSESRGMSFEKTLRFSNFSGGPPGVWARSAAGTRAPRIATAAISVGATIAERDARFIDRELRFTDVPPVGQRATALAPPLCIDVIQSRIAAKIGRIVALSRNRRNLLSAQ